MHMRILIYGFYLWLRLRYHGLCFQILLYYFYLHQWKFRITRCVACIQDITELGRWHMVPPIVHFKTLRQAEQCYLNRFSLNYTVRRDIYYHLPYFMSWTFDAQWI